MTKFLFSLLLCGSTAWAAEFTKWQEKQVLSGLKAYCSSAWCEGDYDYRFRSLECHAKTEVCALHFDLQNRASHAHFPASCSYSPVRSFQDLLTNEGGPDSLSDSFLEALDDCFEKMEDRFSAQSAKVGR